MRSHMPLKIKSIVESFSTKPTRVSFHEAVTLQVASQHALQRKRLVAVRTSKVVSVGGGSRLLL